MPPPNGRIKLSLPKYENLIEQYDNSRAGNDETYCLFHEATLSSPILYEHRRYVEKNGFGFGDPAFHSMWLWLLETCLVQV